MPTNLSISINGMTDVKDLLKDIKGNVPLVLAKSLTYTARVVRDGLKVEMTQVFDRPTPWTLNSLRVEMATPENLQATVSDKDVHYTSGYGTAAWKYLYPQIVGGKRNVRRFEEALRWHGVLPMNMYIVPGKYCDLDKYGNMSVGQIRQILSYFGSAERAAGYMMNMSGKRKARLAKGTKSQAGFEYLINQNWNRGLAPGIYKRLTNRWHSPLFSIMIFIKTPHYKPLFDFFGKGKQIADQEWRGIVEQEIEKMLERSK